MKARLLIEVQCSTCERTTRASAVLKLHLPVFAFGLGQLPEIEYAEMAFPPNPDGTPSAWTVVDGQARCPGCAAGGKGE